MDASQLSPQQAGDIYQHVRDAFHYLAALQKRMEERQFPQWDRLYVEVQAARYAIQLLADDLHRMACGAAYVGTAKPAEPERE
jgi:hypothetical protein